jgi:hypothetical protein
VDVPIGKGICKRTPKDPPVARATDGAPENSILNAWATRDSRTRTDELFGRDNNPADSFWSVGRCCPLTGRRNRQYRRRRKVQQHVTLNLVESFCLGIERVDK